MGVDKRIHDLKSLVTDNGFSVLEVNRKRHVKLTITDGDVVFMVVGSTTPSCRRSNKNFVTRMRRAHREAKKNRKEVSSLTQRNPQAMTLANPLFRRRVVSPKKGRGSYDRGKSKAAARSSSEFSQCHDD